MDNKKTQNKNKLNIFLNKYFNLILSIFLLLVLALSFFLIIMPKYNNARTVIQDNINNQQLLYAQQKKKYDTLVLIDSMYKTISTSDLNKFNSVLPSAYRQERLFGEFEEIIRKSGWILNTISVSDQGEGEAVVTEDGGAGFVYGTSNPNVGRLGIKLSISGVDYNGSKKLLKVLEENMRLFDVTQISLKENGADVSLVTYYYKQAE